MRRKDQQHHQVIFLGAGKSITEVISQSENAGQSRSSAADFLRVASVLIVSTSTIEITTAVIRSTSTAVPSTRYAKTSATPASLTISRSDVPELIEVTSAEGKKLRLFAAP